jgi:hypothetical protein
MSPLEDIVIEDTSVLPDCIIDEIDSYMEGKGHGQADHVD